MIVAYVSLQEHEFRRKRLSLRFAIYLSIFFLIIGFRETGGDYSTYLFSFKMISEMSFSDAVLVTDPIFAALNWISAQLGLGMYGVNAVGAGLYLYGFYRFSARETRPYLMFTVSVPYLVIVVVMGYSRQGVAIGILLWAYTCLNDKKLIKYVLLCLLAVGFHKSAIVMLPLSYFAMTITKGLTLNLLRIMFLAFGIALIILQYLVEGTNLWTYYVTSDHYSSQGALVRTSMGAVAALVFFRYWFIWGERWNDRGIWMAFSIVSLLAVPISLIASTAVDRIALYFIPLQLVVFSRLPSLQKTGRAAQVAVIGVVSGYALVLYVWLFMGQFTAELWLPYKALILGEIP